MKLVQPSNIKRSEQVLDKFGGFNNTLSAKPYEFADMKNLSSDKFPMISQRGPRELVRTLSIPNGMDTDGNKLFWVDGVLFYYDGVSKGTVSNTKKKFVEINKYILIFPDNAFYDTVGDVFGSFDAPKLSIASRNLTVHSWINKVITIKNTLVAGDIAPLAGRKIQIRNATYTVASATAGSGNTATITVSETIATAVSSGDLITPYGTPEMDHVVVHDNRVFGVKGQNIYASKQGDFKSWITFAGLNTDSYATDVAGYGNFQGITKYQNHLVMQTETTMFEMYGYKPSNFQVQETIKHGLIPGTYAELESALFFANENGVYAYTGGIPRSMTEKIIDKKFVSAKAGTDKMKYYLSLYDGSEYSLLIYDFVEQLWHKEDNLNVMDFAFLNGSMYALCTDGKMLKFNSGTEEISWSMTTPENFEGDFFNKKGLRTIELYAYMQPDSYMAAYVKESEQSDFRLLATYLSEREKNLILPVLINSKSYQLKIEGRGRVDIRAIKRIVIGGGKI